MFEQQDSPLIVEEQRRNRYRETLLPESGNAEANHPGQPAPNLTENIREHRDENIMLWQFEFAFHLFMELNSQPFIAIFAAA